MAKEMFSRGMLGSLRRKVDHFRRSFAYTDDLMSISSPFRWESEKQVAVCDGENVFIECFACNLNDEPVPGTLCNFTVLQSAWHRAIMKTEEVTTICMQDNQVFILVWCSKERTELD
ncbi:hypothetical protein SAMN05421736_12443 [Evansella caseinilytica]|uniref:Uncharacterized protein n=1 Tax=Evansella caseinilytica TaxID=1503961 RepID=A0A1H3UPS5_9BACI|nr:hypothetical protein [Evansella caseinilytica]SDZ64384.1 hypothetical protein SAMN05421736_12443 [Evansella caseinilytica]